MTSRCALFLDIDGVIGGYKYQMDIVSRAGLRGRDSVDPSLMLEPVLIDRLNRIICGLSVTVVLSSSWRQGYPFGMIRRWMKDRGFDGDLHSYTQNLGGDRADEIRAWLHAHPDVDRCVILDDQEDAGLGMEHCFVQTDPSIGLTDEDVKRARCLLEHGVKEYP